jgi:hypothetical protein
VTNEPGQEQTELLAAVGDEWLAHGTSTEPADRPQAEWAVRAAIESAGRQTHSMVFIWVDSPMAGVLASTFVGFAMSEPMKQPMTTQLEAALGRSPASATETRARVDDTVWRARNAVHAQIAVELQARGPEWERRRRDIGSYAWDRVWQTVGDPMYDHAFGDQARAADGLFESNLAPWADAMMEGQFGAGAMAALDATYLVDDVDIAPFDGIRRLASNCGWWWAYEAGAVLCERPARFEVSGDTTIVEFRDGWTVRT